MLAMAMENGFKFFPHTNSCICSYIYSCMHSYVNVATVHGLCGCTELIFFAVAKAYQCN